MAVTVKFEIQGGLCYYKTRHGKSYTVGERLLVDTCYGTERAVEVIANAYVDGASVLTKYGHFEDRNPRPNLSAPYTEAEIEAMILASAAENGCITQCEARNLAPHEMCSVCFDDYESWYTEAMTDMVEKYGCAMACSAQNLSIDEKCSSCQEEYYKQVNDSAQYNIEKYGCPNACKAQDLEITDMCPSCYDEEMQRMAEAEAHLMEHVS